MDKLDKPAFGPDSETTEPKIPDSQPEPKQEPTPSVPEKEEGAKDLKVPMWRFNEMYYQAMEAGRASKQATEEANRLREKYEELLTAQTIEKQNQSTDLPSYWVELYGDSDASKRAFRIEQERISNLEAKLQRTVEEKIEQKQYAETQRVQMNSEMIDVELENLNSSLGRELTDEEQSALLDIVDEYTPKDQNGDYLGGLISFDKAWQIYELQKKDFESLKIVQRNQVANAVNSVSQGEPSAEQNKNFNPLDWNAWKKRI